jgi:hypothetical protein
MRPTEGKLRFGPYQGKEHHACLTVAVEKPRCDDLIKILSKFKQFLHTLKYLFYFIYVNTNVKPQAPTFLSAIAVASWRR